MRHLKKGRKLKRTSSHKKALMRTLASALFEHKHISTTEAKAKELRPYAEHLITKAKRALAKEKQGQLPDGQTIDVHNRRMVYRDIRNKGVVQELFDTIAPLVEDRAGGYTRIIKTGQRRGDGSRTAIIELVDWSAPQDGATSFKSKKKAKARPARERKPKEQKVEAADEVVDETTIEMAEENIKDNKKDVTEDNIAVDSANADKVEDVKEEVPEGSEGTESTEANQVTEAKVSDGGVAENDKVTPEDKKEENDNEEKKD